MVVTTFFNASEVKRKCCTKLELTIQRNHTLMFLGGLIDDGVVDDADCPLRSHVQ